MFLFPTTTGKFHTVIHTSCIFCNTQEDITVNTDDYNDWIDGKCIQSAFRHLNTSQREVLISGICTDCFDDIALLDETEDHHKSPNTQPGL